MINVMELGDKTIGECENCGCRFAVASCKPLCLMLNVQIVERSIK